MFNQLLSMLGVPDESTPVPGRLSDEDLERMLFASMQGGDRGKADRVRTVQRMRRGEAEPTLAEAMAERNRSAQQQQPNIGGRYNPYNAINQVLGQ